MFFLAAPPPNPNPLHNDCPVSIPSCALHAQPNCPLLPHVCLSVLGSLATCRTGLLSFNPVFFFWVLAKSSAEAAEAFERKPPWSAAYAMPVGDDVCAKVTAADVLAVEEGHFFLGGGMCWCVLMMGSCRKCRDFGLCRRKVGVST